ncbi:MAG: hypothetical protein AB7I27_15780 [Bacteriovoracaceae bacterium]
MFENFVARVKEFMSVVKVKTLPHEVEHQKGHTDQSVQSKDSRTMTNDEKIDEAIDESFPASDPPAY